MTEKKEGHERPASLKKGDFSVIEKSRYSDQEAFKLLAAEYDRMIHKIISFFDVPESERDDLYQEGLIGLYKAVMLYNPSYASFSTFAYICIKRNIITAVKQYNKKSLTYAVNNDQDYFDISESETFKDQSSDPACLFINKESFKLLLDKIDGALSPFENTVLGLHLSGMDHGTIAQTLKKPRKSVDNALMRVRNKLKMLLD